jgi:hypothetical protein
MPEIKTGVYKHKLDSSLYMVFKDSKGELRVTSENTCPLVSEFERFHDLFKFVSTASLTDAVEKMLRGSSESVAVAMVYDVTLAVLATYLPDKLPEYVRSQVAAAHEAYRHVMGPDEEPMSIGLAAGTIRAKEPPPTLEMGIQKVPGL